MGQDRLYFKTYGEGSNVLIMLHAFPVNHNLFGSIGTEMLPQDWAVMIPDFPGFGNTPEDRHNEILTMKHLARLVKEIIPKKDGGKIVLGGVSMGGYVAMAFEKQYPNTIDAYILSNTRDAADPDGGKGREETVYLIEAGKRREWLENDFIPKAVGTTTLERRPELIQKCWNMFDQTTDRAIKQTMKGMGGRSESRTTFSQLDIPILIITGDEDLLTGPDIAKDMAHAYRNAEMQIISQTGHFAPLENPDMYAKTIKSFLKGL